MSVSPFLFSFSFFGVTKWRHFVILNEINRKDQEHVIVSGFFFFFSFVSNEMTNKITLILVKVKEKKKGQQ